MEECPVLLPQDFNVPAENVSGGHTVGYYGTVVTGAFTLAATILSLGLAFAHMTHYSQPNEQKHIIRILFMVPIYTLLSSICALSYPASLYLEPLQEFYEAIALASIFNLFCNYIWPTFSGQFELLSRDEAYMQVQSTQAVGAMNQPSMSTRRLKIVMIAVYQYIVVKALTTILTMITQAAGVYCEDSTKPYFAHIWLMVIAMASLVVCILAILNFYRSLKPSLAHHKAILQLLCIKIVVILDTIQVQIIKILLSRNVIQVSHTWTYGDITVMIPSLLITIESFIVAIMFFFAYSPRTYYAQPRAITTTTMETGVPTGAKPYSGGFLGIKALFEAVFVWDLLVNTGRAFRLIPHVLSHANDDGDYSQQERQQIITSSNNNQVDYRKLSDQSSPDMLPTQGYYRPYGASPAHH